MTLATWEGGNACIISSLGFPILVESSLKSKVPDIIRWDTNGINQQQTWEGHVLTARHGRCHGRNGIIAHKRISHPSNTKT